MFSLLASIRRTRAITASPARPDPEAPAKDGSIAAEPPRLLGPTPREHAQQVARLFLDHVHAEGHSLELTTSSVVIMARNFARAARLKVPADRTVLSEIKRLPGVRVEQDRRVFDGYNVASQKTSVYIFPLPGSSAPRWPRYRVIAPGGR